MNKTETGLAASPADCPSIGRRRGLAMICAAAISGCMRGRDTPATAVLATGAGEGKSACVLSPALTEGPFFVDHGLRRADLRVGSKDPSTIRGVPLTLRLQLVDATGACAPIAGARVDVWHANVDGLYSAEPAQVMQPQDTSADSFLRGYQTSDALGRVQFLTIFPGRYGRRAPHIHFKVRRYTGDRMAYEYTSQLFFEDDFASHLYASAPHGYGRQSGATNRADHIYDPHLLVVLGKAPTSDGYEGDIVIGLKGPFS
ncbi:MAG: hypothetical protein HY255_06880 [Betaproteobacteria bacterium]|nr:hypothetical protein [Betaproteobacteria bacterium]